MLTSVYLPWQNRLHFSWEKVRSMREVLIARVLCSVAPYLVVHCKNKCRCSLCGATSLGVNFNTSTSLLTQLEGNRMISPVINIKTFQAVIGIVLLRIIRPNQNAV